MKKVTLDYDEANGMIYDANGMFISTWMNLQSFADQITNADPTPKVTEETLLSLAAILTNKDSIPR